MSKKIVGFFLVLVCVSVGIYAGSEHLVGSPFPAERHFEFSYHAILPEIPQDAHLIRVWIPLASGREGQKILRREVTASIPYQVEKESVFGNEMLYAEVKEPAARPLDFKIDYEAVVEKNASGSVDSSELEKFLKPSRLMVQTKEVQERAQEATTEKKNGWDKARGIYDYVIEHMTYDKTIPGWGKGDTLRACLLGKGNCTDFHSLFISMAHAVQIPSRFKIGFTIPPKGEGKIPGYHCWAEFYDSAKGWIQVDALEAWKHPKMKQHYFGDFDTNKFFVSVGRDIDLVPKQEAEPVNIFIYPYVEADGKPVGEGKVQTDFSFKTVSF